MPYTGICPKTNTICGSQDTCTADDCWLKELEAEGPEISTEQFCEYCNNKPYCRTFGCINDHSEVEVIANSNSSLYTHTISR